MKIEEAIQNTKEAAVYLSIHHQDRLAKGVRLGIEALKKLQELRSTDLRWYDALLLGETEK